MPTALDALPGPSAPAPAELGRLPLLMLRCRLPLCTRRQGLEKAKQEEYDAVIVDTAGRLQIDERLMEELREVRKSSGDCLF